jgi:hypothetical protein
LPEEPAAGAADDGRDAGIEDGRGAGAGTEDAFAGGLDVDESVRDVGRMLVGGNVNRSSPVSVPAAARSRI